MNMIKLRTITEYRSGNKLYFTSTSPRTMNLTSNSEKSHRIIRCKTDYTPKKIEQVKKAPLANQIDEKMSKLHQNSLLTQEYDKIVDNLKNFSQETIKKLMLNSVLQEMQKAKLGFTDVRALELIALQTSQELETLIFKELLFPDENTAREALGSFIAEARFKKDPYDRFDLKFLTQFVEKIGELVSQSIGYIGSFNDILAKTLQNLWLGFIYIADMVIQWSKDKNNNYVKQQTSLKLHECQLIREQSKLVEQKSQQQIKLKEQHIKDISERYIELEEKYDELQIQFNDLVKQREVEVKVTKSIGLSQMRQNVMHMKSGLNELTAEMFENRLNFQKCLKNIGNAVVRIQKNNNNFAGIRNMLEINFTKQQPGDGAYGHLVSDHPWIPYIRMSNIQKQDGFLTLTEKQSLLHQMFTKSIDSKYSPCWQFLLHHDDFSSDTFYDSLNKVIRCQHQQTIYDHVIQKLFNLKGFLGIDIHSYKILKQLYQRLIKANPQFKNEANIFLQTIPHVQLIIFLEDLYSGQPEMKDFIKLYEEDQNETVTCIQLIYQLMTFLYDHQSIRFSENVNKFLDTISQMSKPSEVFNLRTVSLMTEIIFQNYAKLCKHKLLSYLVWTHYLQCDKKFDETEQKKLQLPFMGFSESTPNNFFRMVIQKIKSLLTFDPQLFYGMSQQDQSQEYQNVFDLNKIQQLKTRRESLLHKRK